MQKLSWFDNHFDKNVKKVHFLALTVAIMLLVMVPIQSVSAASLPIPITTIGSHTVSYRDISNLDPTPDPIISYDGNGHLSITDFNADLDVNAIDTTTVTVGSDPVILTESGVDSKTFNALTRPAPGTEIIYTPDPPESARAEVTLDFASTGGVTLSDVIIADTDIDSMCFRPVTHALKVELTGGATLTATDTVVKLSYSNGIFVDGDDITLLQIYYKKTGQGWSSLPLASFGSFGTYDFDAQTITSDSLGGSFPSQITTGQFILGFETGCGGGGGGGLIRPGLVLNILAGLNLGGMGPDISAPSLHFGSASTEDGFGGTLVTDDNNSFPLVINGMGYYLPLFSTSITPVQVNTGQDVDLTLTFLESTGVEHVAIHFVNENNDEMSDADAIITYHKGDVTKSDPEGILNDDITFSKTKDGNKYSFNYTFSFDEPTNRHLMITAWDDNKNSENAKVFNAFTVSGEPVPDEGISHMIYLDLGAYFITADGIFAAGEKTAVAEQPVFGYEYPDSVGRTERHDSIIYDQIANEKAKASQVMAEKFNLDTSTFVEDNEVKPYDTSRRASELDSPFVGHNLRDYTMTPEENGKLIKELSWKEHLKAQKILDSLFVGTKYQK